MSSFKAARFLNIVGMYIGSEDYLPGQHGQMRKLIVLPGMGYEFNPDLTY